MLAGKYGSFSRYISKQTTAERHFRIGDTNNCYYAQKQEAEKVITVSLAEKHAAFVSVPKPYI